MSMPGFPVQLGAGPSRSVGQVPAKRIDDEPERRSGEGGTLGAQLVVGLDDDAAAVFDVDVQIVAVE